MIDVVLSLGDDDGVDAKGFETGNIIGDCCINKDGDDEEEDATEDITGSEDNDEEDNDDEDSDEEECVPDFNFDNDVVAEIEEFCGPRGLTLSFLLLEDEDDVDEEVVDEAVEDLVVC